MDFLLPILIFAAFFSLVAAFTAPKQLATLFMASAAFALCGMVALYANMIVNPLETPDPVASPLGPEVFVGLIALGSLTVLIGIGAVFASALKSLRTSKA